jgi:hypothetical protein
MATEYVMQTLRHLTDLNRLGLEEVRFGLSAVRKLGGVQLPEVLHARLLAWVSTCEDRLGGFDMCPGLPQELSATYYGLLTLAILGGTPKFVRRHIRFLLSRRAGVGFVEVGEVQPSVAIYYSVRALQHLGEPPGIDLTDISHFACPTGGYRLSEGLLADLDPTYEALSLFPCLGRPTDVRFITNCRRILGYVRRPDASPSLPATFWAVQTLRLLSVPVDPLITNEVLLAQCESGGFAYDWQATAPSLWPTYAAAAILEPLDKR